MPNTEYLLHLNVTAMATKLYDSTTIKHEYAHHQEV